MAYLSHDKVPLRLRYFLKLLAPPDIIDKILIYFTRLFDRQVSFHKNIQKLTERIAVIVTFAIPMIPPDAMMSIIFCDGGVAAASAAIGCLK